MLRSSGLALVAALLVAGSAAAQTSDDGETRVSPTDDQHIEALFQAQQPVDDFEGQSGEPTLTREQIAAYRSESGWGKAFKEMQADGYFLEYKNFGQLISASRSKIGGLESEAARVRAERVDGIKPDKPEKVRRVERTQRVSRIDRPKRPDRPNRPARR